MLLERCVIIGSNRPGLSPSQRPGDHRPLASSLTCTRAHSEHGQTHTRTPKRSRLSSSQPPLPGPAPRPIQRSWKRFSDIAVTLTLGLCYLNLLGSSTQTQPPPTPIPRIGQIELVDREFVILFLPASLISPTTGRHFQVILKTRHLLNCRLSGHT